MTFIKYFIVSIQKLLGYKQKSILYTYPIAFFLMEYFKSHWFDMISLGACQFPSDIML